MFRTHFCRCFLNIGKRAFIAGVADDQGYGWAIAKALAAAGAEILVGTWVPVCSLYDCGR
jgi:enoyl-[acyl-carrier protein] reductase I